MSRSTGRYVACLLLAAGFWLTAPPLVSTASACSTPVFRYAMYRWEPAPYEVYYFHRGPLDEQVAEQHQWLKAVARSEERPANLFVLAVDLEEDPELGSVPGDIRQRWQSLEDPQTPCYLVVTPQGVPIHRGDLQRADVQALIDSPARQQIVQQLAEGKAGVMVLLTGSDDAANAAAEKVVRDFAADVAGGKIQMYTPPAVGVFPSVPEPGEQDEPSKPAVEIGYVRMDREDPGERWTVQSLLSMEPDLKDEQFAAQPMMFVLFGRGRALPPCVGQGIHRNNLLHCLDFVTGPCSCTVKDQNPGLDLLFAADWHRAAERLAARAGGEEGSEYLARPEVSPAVD